jgi:hypothetical protein
VALAAIPRGEVAGNKSGSERGAVSSLSSTNTMFNKTFLFGESRGPSHVTVHEHKAPTDASIKLYDELLAKARAEVVSVVAHDLESNVLSHAVMEARYALDTMKSRYFVVFRLNGREHKLQFDVEVGPREQMERAIVAELGGAVAKTIWQSLPIFKS